MDLFARQPSETVLKVKVPPTLGIRWFVPRLVHFHGQHPDIDVQITTSHQPVVAQCTFVQDDLATGRLVAPFPLERILLNPGHIRLP